MTTTGMTDVPGGTAMTRAYVEAFSAAPEPGLLAGVVPVAFGRIAMLVDYVDPEERFVVCPNQDVVYGAGFLPLDRGPVVFQVPDFGGRFWVFNLYDARTDQFSEIGQQHGTKPGFYLVAGPDWQGETPAGITAVVRSSTPLAFAIPRVFMDDTEDDHQAIQPLLSQSVFYPLPEFDGTVKTKDWGALPVFPAPPSSGKGETRWVNPETFFDQLPAVLEQVPPMAGEEALYSWVGNLLEAAAGNPEIQATLKQTAIAAENELIAPLMQWRYNGRPAGNGWNSTVDAANWGRDYLNRTAVAKSSMYANIAAETKYFFTEHDTQGGQLHGRNSYAVTFADGHVPVRGFWSLTVYNEQHLFEPNQLRRFSLGTKNKNLKHNPDGSLTLYAGAKSPGPDKEANWLPAPEGAFSFLLRAYWPDETVLDGTWQPPAIEKL